MLIPESLLLVVIWGCRDIFFKVSMPFYCLIYSNASLTTTTTTTPTPAPTPVPGENTPVPDDSTSTAGATEDSPAGDTGGLSKIGSILIGVLVPAVILLLALGLTVFGMYRN